MEHALTSLAASLSLPLLLGLIVVCIAVLSKGADWMIEGVVDLAQRTGMPRIIIGATIVSLGTTLPEAFVSVTAAWMGTSGLALGNGVGSIIADTGLVLGVACLLTRVPMNIFILNRTGWVQVGTATLLVVLALFARWQAPEMPVLGRKVGVFFLVLLVGYIYLSYFWAKAGGEQVVLGEDEASRPLPVSLILIVIGLTLVILGARVLVPAASEVALRLGVPEDIIAATMVALGTSLPELVTGITAVRKGHPEVMVGNVVGADVLNCLFVIGAAATARPLVVHPTFFTFHFPAMLLILYSLRIFIGMNQDGYFKRWQGGWLLAVYLGYIIVQYGSKLGG
jgi:cation:H+ antiporter